MLFVPQRHKEIGDSDGYINASDVLVNFSQFLHVDRNLHEFALDLRLHSHQLKVILEFQRRLRFHCIHVN